MNEIILPKIEMLGANDMFDASKHLSSAKEFLKKCENRELVNAVEELYGKTEVILSEVYKVQSDRIDEIEKLLFKYYKATAESEKGYKYVRYIFPYYVNKVNYCIFALVANLENVYLGGVKDCAFSLEDIMKYDIKLEEITDYQFKEAARISVDKAIDYRLGRIAAKKNNSFFTINS